MTFATVYFVSMFLAALLSMFILYFELRDGEEITQRFIITQIALIFVPVVNTLAIITVILLVLLSFFDGVKPLGD